MAMVVIRLVLYIRLRMLAYMLLAAYSIKRTESFILVNRFRGVFERLGTVDATNSRSI